MPLVVDAWFRDAQLDLREFARTFSGVDAALDEVCGSGRGKIGADGRCGSAVRDGSSVPVRSETKSMLDLHRRGGEAGADLPLDWY